MRSVLLVTLCVSASACIAGGSGPPTLPDGPKQPDAALNCLNGETPGQGGPLNLNDGVGGGPQCGAGMGGSGSGSACLHQVGTDCLGSCHGAGQNTQANAPLFSVGGTLYADPTGINPLGGAIIEIVDSMGTTQKLVTANNGNFFVLGGSGATSFPVGEYNAKATQCPGTHTMNTKQANGSCNASACHDSASVNGRAYLVPGQP
jgi:hypothetical protein